MKRFFVTLLAVIIGGIILSILPMIILFSIAGAMSSDKDNVEVKDNTVLVMNLSSSIQDRDVSDPSSLIQNMISGNSAGIGLNDIKSTLKKAKTDDRIKGLILKGAQTNASINTVKEVHDAIADFKTSGKFVYFYDSSIAQSSLLAAAKADGIYVNPAGDVDVHGISVLIQFYKGLIDKLGLNVEIIRHGQFKSAVEPFMLNKMSDASRLQTQRYIDVIWQNVRDSIAAGRNIAAADVDEYVNKLMSSDINNALAVGLVDSLCYEDEFIAKMKAITNTPEDQELNTVDFGNYIKVFSPNEELNFSTNKVAVIYAVGEISDGSNKSDKANIYGDDLANTIREARKDDDVKAIVMRVNSPGGSALASEVIWREVSLAASEKPFIVSMGDYAASGGYYISCAADSIFAEPTTITGSIGVFGILPVVGPALEKFGVNTEKVQSNKYSQIDGFSPISDMQRDAIQRSVENVYATFTRRCANGRKTTVEHIDSIGQGRVWAGEDAINIGLVDKLGSLDDAIRCAANAADIADDYIVEELPSIDESFGFFVRQFSKNAETFVGKSMFGDTYGLVKRYETLTKQKSIQARMEYTFMEY